MFTTPVAGLEASGRLTKVNGVPVNFSSLARTKGIGTHVSRFFLHPAPVLDSSVCVNKLPQRPLREGVKLLKPNQGSIANFVLLNGLLNFVIQFTAGEDKSFEFFGG